ncbi:phosphoenolpyruvate--protein phosphotransferase [Tessaracoccus lubricantis]|uniref:phosphoenolpyruvate--protein phosphotransferase n=1 Tax=Tessaracoccus lubricantis TaxID=545543 RepID=UPI00364339DD
MTDVVRGTGVVAGVVKAPVVWKRPHLAPPTPLYALPSDHREAEAEEFMQAVQTVAAGYEERARRAKGAAAKVLMATAQLASDRGWVRPALKAIADGVPAATAAINAIESIAATFRRLGGVMAERVSDLGDIRDRVVSRLSGEPEPGVPMPEQPSILLADDLSPADTADLDLDLIIAIATKLGGPTSHTAIIARQRGLPCVVGVPDLQTIGDGDVVLLDGAAGTLTRRLSEVDADALVQADARRRAAIDGWAGPGVTADGKAVQLLANVADGAAARAAAVGPVEGVGLYRTELGFLNSLTEPTIDHQADTYAEVLDAFPGRKVVVRTLDAGTDKPVPFASLADEPNPALGIRGQRLAITRPGLIRRQLDAIAMAAMGRDPRPWVMAPMISTVDEAARFAEECRARDLFAGVMVEVPAVALLAEEFLKVVDFVSIGTNDLTQYVMAADRLAPDLAHLTTPWQPGLLRLVKMTADAGLKLGKPVGVCGEAAADPAMACVLVGMGITSLSMAAAALPAVGVQLSKITTERCRRAAEAALTAAPATDARSAAVAEL